MARGEIYLEDGQLRGLEGIEGLTLPSASLDISSRELSHPYYWAAFTMIGNPW
jgi:CHAT domain-containing protein